MSISLSKIEAALLRNNETTNDAVLMLIDGGGYLSWEAFAIAFQASRNPHHPDPKWFIETTRNYYYPIEEDIVVTPKHHTL